MHVVEMFVQNESTGYNVHLLMSRNVRSMVLSINCVWSMFKIFPSSTSLTYIALQPLGAFDLSLTHFNIHSIDHMVGKL